MSATVPVRYHDFHFWVFDMSAALLWATAADIAAAREQSEWLAGVVHQMRVDALLGADQAVWLDDWADGHEDEFTALVAAAADRLAERGTVTEAEAADWVVIDDEPILWRSNTSEFPTAPAVEFGQAVIDIIRGDHPAPPPGRTWYFGQPQGVVTVDWVGVRP